MVDDVIMGEWMEILAEVLCQCQTVGCVYKRPVLGNGLAHLLVLFRNTFYMSFLSVCLSVCVSACLSVYC